MEKYVTTEHFDTTVGELRREFVSQRHFDATLQKYVTQEHFDVTIGELRNELVTKDEFHTRMDEVVTILRRVDQERMFMVEWVKRIDTDVTRIKTHLNLA